MADERVHEFPYAGRFTRDYQPDPSLAAKGRKANSDLRKTYLDVLDMLGGSSWLKSFVQKSDENARVYVSGLVRMMPMEIKGSLDTSLTVRVVTQLGDEVPAVDITRPKQVPKDAASLPATPASLEVGRVPEEPDG